MNGNCHLINGLAVSTMVSLNIHILSEYTSIGMCDKSSAIALIVMGGLIGSVFPDIDNVNSNVGQLCKPVSTVIDYIQSLYGKTGSNHRGVFHDIAFYLTGFLISLIWCPYLFGFFLGGMSHIFLDALTPAGVPYVLGMGRFRISRVPSGSKRSVVITYLLAILIFEIGISLFFYTRSLIG